MLYKKYFFSISWAIIILGLTLIPGKNLPETNWVGIDKVVHLIMYSLLMFLLLLDFRKQHKTPFSTYVAYSFLLSLLFGLSIEVLQHFVPGRSFSVLDIIANSLGVVAGYYSFNLFSKK